MNNHSNLLHSQFYDISDYYTVVPTYFPSAVSQFLWCDECCLQYQLVHEENFCEPSLERLHPLHFRLQDVPCIFRCVCLVEAPPHVFDPVRETLSTPASNPWSTSSNMPGDAAVHAAAMPADDDGVDDATGPLIPPCGTNTTLFFLFFFWTFKCLPKVWFNSSFFQVCIQYVSTLSSPSVLSNSADSYICSTFSLASLDTQIRAYKI